MATAEVGALRVSLSLATAAFVEGARKAAETARTAAARISDAFRAAAASVTASMVTMGTALQKQIGAGLKSQVEQLRGGLFSLISPVGLIVTAASMGLGALIGYATKTKDEIAAVDEAIEGHRRNIERIEEAFDRAETAGVQYSGNVQAALLQAKLAEQQALLTAAVEQFRTTVGATADEAGGAMRGVSSEFASFGFAITGFLDQMEAGTADIPAFIENIGGLGRLLGEEGTAGELIVLIGTLLEAQAAIADTAEEIAGIGGAASRTGADLDSFIGRMEAIARFGRDSVFGDIFSDLITPTAPPERPSGPSQRELEQERINEILLQKEAEFEKAWTDTVAIEEQRRQQLRQAALGGVASIFGSLAQIVGEGSERAFKISKAFSIGEAAINTGLAITKALTGPFPFITAASVAAAGAAQIAGILRAQPGSASVPAVGGAPATGGAAAGGGEASGPGQTLTIRGLNRGDLFSGDSVRELAEKLMDFQRNGGKVVYA